MPSFLSLFAVGVALSLSNSSALPFRPTRTGSSQMPELFWVQNDRGIVVPAFLHGVKPSGAPRAIEDDVEFHLYNSKNPSSSVLLMPGCTNGCLSTLVPGAPVVFLVHGFSSDHLGGFGDGLRTNFNKPNVAEMNLIFVNWGALAGAPWYETAANNVAPVGQYTARLIEFIVNSGAAPMTNIVFAGHSLGSHVANFVANGLPLSMKLPVIHALDPALPLFGERPDSGRIDPMDADFVNVIHSASGTLLDGGLAFTEPRGHVDFYPNTGKNQPGCGADYFGACSHSRAHEYFGESVNHDAFSACVCASYENFGDCDCNISTHKMGWSTPRSTRGIYYLTTRGASPYGLD